GQPDRWVVDSCRGAAHSWLSALSLHDALPIYLLARLSCRELFADENAHVAGQLGRRVCDGNVLADRAAQQPCNLARLLFEIARLDRKSTRLNSSHLVISYAVFCLKTKEDVNDS